MLLLHIALGADYVAYRGLHAFQIFVNNINEFLQQEQERLKGSSSSSDSPPSPKLDPEPELEPGPRAEPKSRSKAKSKAKPSVYQNRALRPNRFTYVIQRVREREAQHGHDLDSLVPILSASSQALREACEEAVVGAEAWFKGCNSGRWTGFFLGGSVKETKAREVVGRRLVEVTEKLKKVLGEWKETERVGLIKPYERFFDSETGRLNENVRKDKVNEMFAARFVSLSCNVTCLIKIIFLITRSLFVCFVFSYALDAFAERLLQLLEILIELDPKRQRSRVWMPSGFGKLGRKIMSKSQIDHTVAPLAMGTSDDPTQFDDVTESDTDEGTVDDEKTEGIEKKEAEDSDSDEVEEIKYWDTRESPLRFTNIGYGSNELVRCIGNPDALPPTTDMGRSLVKIGAVFRFLKSDEGIFSLRVAVVSVALWVPAVCRSTAWFYYGNRGLWALIMAQIGLAVYSGDQVGVLSLSVFLLRGCRFVVLNF